MTILHIAKESVIQSRRRRIYFSTSSRFLSAPRMTSPKKSYLSLLKTLGTHNYYVYFMTNRLKTVLYIGITNDLKSRVYQHAHPDTTSRAFTTKYRCKFLVYYEQFNSVEVAIAREKQLKGWSRLKKENLIKTQNPQWKFLNEEI